MTDLYAAMEVQCGSCPVAYVEAPLLSPCDSCALTIDQMLAVEELFNAQSDEDTSGLGTDPAGGLFLKLI